MNDTLIGYSRIQEPKNFGKLIVSTSTLVCKVINVKSNMPILTIGFNLFLLLLLSLSTLVISWLLIKKIRKKNKRTKNSNTDHRILLKDVSALRVSFSTKSEIVKNPLSRPKTIKMDSNSLTKFIVFITVFSAVLNIPSLITRNIFMIAVNIQPDDPGSTWRAWQAWIYSLCDQLDYLLLFSSSQKFLIFIFKCKLIRIPTERFCIIRCNLRF